MNNNAMPRFTNTVLVLRLRGLNSISPDHTLVVITVRFAALDRSTPMPANLAPLPDPHTNEIVRDHQSLVRNHQSLIRDHNLGEIIALDHNLHGRGEIVVITMIIFVVGFRQPEIVDSVSGLASVAAILLAFLKAIVVIIFTLHLYDIARYLYDMYST
ncbi:hypothetical protein C8R44DRAFT_880171 [Mycena epipterygia]|nr:hypothetical protein C8R44DRAFT_896224 [Mycena epipterygia]KAJ7115752.1 hypothetical protein C8R44DRAFT_880171 [Mycena epipterygia]